MVKLGPPPDAAANDFNVILVSIDTLRADRLGCYGYKERSSSPVIDALAKESVLFENLITAAPWTTPAHLSMLTSLHPSSHGLTFSFGEMWGGLFGVKGKNCVFYSLPKERLTMAEALGAAGYKTAAFTAGGPLEPALGFDQGFGSYGTSMYKLYDENVGAMLAWLKENKGDKLFMFWHHFEVHAPYLHGDYLKGVAEEGRVEPLTRNLEKIASEPLATVWPGGAATQRRRQLAMLKAHNSFNREVCEALYVGGVHSADRWLGKLVDTLKKEGIYDDTMLIVTSDHGESFAERDKSQFYNRHGHIVYDEMIHVPMLIKMPKGYGAGVRVSELTSNVDIMPTVLDFLKVTPEKDEMEGLSLLPFLTGEGRAPLEGREIFTEGITGQDEKKSVRTERYKYIVSIAKKDVVANGRSVLPAQPEKEELYDLQKDPQERKNLLESDDADAKKLAAHLSASLRKHLKDKKGKAEKITLDDATLQKLEGLGYIGD